MITTMLARELKLPIQQIEAAVHLLEDGATVPFIARYRKEATGGLDDVALRQISARLIDLQALLARRAAILESLQTQGVLTPELESAIMAARTRTRLEDLYLPFRPKRRTRATIAEEAGLAPLAQALCDNRDTQPEALAAAFVNPDKGVIDVAGALDGARHIIMTRMTEQADLMEVLREWLWRHADISATPGNNQQTGKEKFQDYAKSREPIRKIPAHRVLALLRGRREGFLRLRFVLPDNITPPYDQIVHKMGFSAGSGVGAAWLRDTVETAWHTKIFSRLEAELIARLSEQAEETSIEVFARNLKGLLLAAPAGQQVTMGLDPGIKTGIKVVVMSANGTLLDDAVVYPFAPHHAVQASLTTLAKLAMKYHVALIAIGNGTGSRETERLVADMMKMYPDLDVIRVLVSEAGASVYSASALASEEFPDLDVSLRGAVSIARRLQDPLAELVKIEPKSIGVGQYQHDVHQIRLARSLDAVVEDCVNAVGVDVNTASVALLQYVSGLNAAVAKNIIAFREQEGAFATREDLKKIKGIGEKTFEQAAGFLRITGANPLDASAVHPETYPLIERIASDCSVQIADLVGNCTLLQAIKPEQYVAMGYGLTTIQDALRELEKPGRDPRPHFTSVQFKEGVETIHDLTLDMILDGVVSNVTNFGAFVNIGVHQDGLVHISELTNRYVSDPHQVLKTGDMVRVRVIEVDMARKRIGLSMKLEPVSLRQKETAPRVHTVKKDTVPRPTSQHTPRVRTQPKPAMKKAIPPNPVYNTAMADAFAKLKKGDSL